MLINFRSLITPFIGLLTLSTIIKDTHAQFKMLDSSTFRGSPLKGGRNDDSNITLVMIKTIDDETTPETIVEATSSTFEVSSPSLPRGFMAHQRHEDLSEEEDKQTKVQIDTTEHTTIQRVGKLQEKALLINRKLLENSGNQKLYSRSVDERPKHKSQIIRIQTINPLLRSYTQTIPTKKPIRHTINDNLIDLTLSKPKRVKPEKYQFRKFKSRCRCEKISNCQKLQVSISRCPHDQFMCCF